MKDLLYREKYSMRWVDNRQKRRVRYQWENESCLDVCRATDSAHIEIYWTYKRLCEAQCLQMYRFPPLQ
jgi:hypothetical protein